MTGLGGWLLSWVVRERLTEKLTFEWSLWFYLHWPNCITPPLLFSSGHLDRSGKTWQDDQSTHHSGVGTGTLAWEILAALISVPSLLQNQQLPPFSHLVVATWTHPKPASRLSTLRSKCGFRKSEVFEKITLIAAVDRCLQVAARNKMCLAVQLKERQRCSTTSSLDFWQIGSPRKLQQRENVVSKSQPLLPHGCALVPPSPPSAPPPSHIKVSIEKSGGVHSSAVFSSVYKAPWKAPNEPHFIASSL